MNNAELLGYLKAQTLGVNRASIKGYMFKLERHSLGTPIVAKRSNGTTITGTAWATPVTTITSVTGIVGSNIEVIAT